MYYDFLNSPIGWLKITATKSAITAIDFNAKPSKSINSNTITEQCKQQLSEYFAGKRKHFEVPTDIQGTTFQKAVWRALAKIPYGTTCAYYEIADAIGNSKAVRAVGAANGSNSIPIIIPCHRVIGRDGSLTGFGGGLDIKEWLLKHEGGLF